MENYSRMSSSSKDKPVLSSKMNSAYTSHTRCESVSRPSKNVSKKVEKIHTQAISSRKYNSTYKHSQGNQLRTTGVQSPYRTSFSSMKGQRKSGQMNQQNAKCLSSYNLKDYSFSKQLMNSSEMFSSMYMQPAQMIGLIEKDKPTIRSTYNRKKKSSCNNLKNQFNTKRSIAAAYPLSRNSQKKSDCNLRHTLLLSKSKQYPKRQKSKKSNKSNSKSGKMRKTSSYVLSPTQQSSQDLTNKTTQNCYEEILNRTFEVLNKYENKMKKLYEDKVSYQRMYEKSKTQCENLRKTIRKKQKK